MNYLEKRKERAIKHLKEEIQNYEVKVKEGDPFQSQISFSPLNREIKITCPTSDHVKLENLPFNGIPEEFKILHRANSVLICSEAIKNDNLRRPVPPEFLEPGYDTERPEILEKSKLAQEVFEIPLKIGNERQLRKIPHFQMIDKEIKNAWFERYAESTLRNMKGLCGSKYLEPYGEYSGYSTKRAELRIAFDLANAEPYDIEIPKEYYGTAGYEFFVGKDLFEKEKEMAGEDFEDYMKVVRRWLIDLEIDSDFRWVRSNRIL